MALVDGGAGGAVPILGGRCVGGTTTINTKVAFQAHDFEFAKWHEASGLLGDDGKPFGVETLAPHYERVERVLGVRERADWPECVRTLDAGFRELGHELEPVHSYTDHNCMKCGSCLQGCPTNAGKNTMNTYIHSATADGKLDLRAESPVERVLFTDGDGGLEATGVEYRDADGRAPHDRGGRRRGRRRRSQHASAPDPLGPPGGERQLRLERADRAQPRPPPGRLRVRPLRRAPGRPSRLPDHLPLHGLHARRGRRLRDRGGDRPGPDRLRDQHLGRDGPLWGERLVEATRHYRHWNGILVLANDENNGRVVVGEDGSESFEAHFDPVELERMEAALEFGRRVMKAAGAKRVAWTGPASTHVAGHAARWAATRRARWSTRTASRTTSRRLFVGDASLFPRTLSVNPSMTIMALADRLAEHLDEDPSRVPRAAGGAASRWAVSRVKAALLRRVQHAARARRPARARGHAPEPGPGQDRGCWRLRNRPARDRRRDGAGRDGGAARARA